MIGSASTHLTHTDTHLSSSHPPNPKTSPLLQRHSSGTTKHISLSTTAYWAYDPSTVEDPPLMHPATLSPILSGVLRLGPSLMTVSAQSQPLRAPGGEMERALIPVGWVLRKNWDLNSRRIWYGIWAYLSYVLDFDEYVVVFHRRHRDIADGNPIGLGKGQINTFEMRS